MTLIARTMALICMVAMPADAMAEQPHQKAVQCMKESSASVAGSEVRLRDQIPKVFYYEIHVPKVTAILEKKSIVDAMVACFEAKGFRGRVQPESGVLTLQSTASPRTTISYFDYATHGTEIMGELMVKLVGADN